MKIFDENAIKVMKLNVLDSHDRLLEIRKTESRKISEGAEECMKSKLSLVLQEYSPYIYLYAHARTTDDGSKKRIIWQPRLTRPYPEPNSFLFRGISKSDIVEKCWIIPSQDTWGQNKKGNITEDTFVQWSIDQFKNNREEMSKPDPRDLSDDQIRIIYTKMKEDSKK